MEEQRGERFEAFVRQRWAEVGEGGIRGLCRATGVTPEALYKWFNGETEPKMGHLTALSEALRAPRWQVVAAMDGVLPDLREAIAEDVEAAVGPLRALLRDAGLLQQDVARDGVPLEAPNGADR